MNTENSLDTLKNYYHQHEKQILGDYFDFLRFKSVSTEKKYEKELQACSYWLQKKIEETGFEVERWEGKGHPILFAQNLSAGKEKPTVLFYHHYDVQPTDPEEAWTHPPFEPVVMDQKVYARGAQDNKGQCFYTLSALKAYVDLFQKLPLNVKWIIEGEEEAGSAFLSEILPSKKKALEADYIVIVDTLIPSYDKPAVSLGMRGNFAVEILLKGSSSDLHSGIHGGLAYNPLHAMVKMLNSLRDQEGRILIEDFYESIQSIDKEMLKSIDLSFDEENYQKKQGIPANGGETNYPPSHSNTLRPTLEINGLQGGYTAEGFKTVIPSTARAKISARLVHGQDPKHLVHQLEKKLKSLCPKGINMSFTAHSYGGKAVFTSPHSPLAKAAQKTLEKTFEKPTSLIMCGATIPIASELQQTLNAPLIGLGTGLDSDNIHAPDEHFHLKSFYLGFLSIGELLSNLG